MALGIFWQPIEAFLQCNQSSSGQFQFRRCFRSLLNGAEHSEGHHHYRLADVGVVLLICAVRRVPLLWIVVVKCRVERAWIGVWLSYNIIIAKIKRRKPGAQLVYVGVLSPIHSHSPDSSSIPIQKFLKVLSVKIYLQYYKILRNNSLTSSFSMPLLIVTRSAPMSLQLL